MNPASVATTTSETGVTSRRRGRGHRPGYPSGGGTRRKLVPRIRRTVTVPTGGATGTGVTLLCPGGVRRTGCAVDSQSVVGTRSGTGTTTT